MKSLWAKLHFVGDILHLPDLPKWMCGLLTLMLLLRIPSFFEPYYYGDEMIYLTLGTGVRQGIPLYSGLHDNKPPLLYLTAALSENLFWFKAILAFWSFITIIFFWKLSRIILKNNSKGRVVATVFFALLTTLPLLEGNIANAELFMIGPSILAFLILLGEKLNPKKLFWAGILFGIAALYKIPAAFDLPVIIVFWLVTDFASWKKIIKRALILAAGFATPIFLTFLWYFLSGSLSEYIKAAFLQNVGYLGSLKPPVDIPIFIRAFAVFTGIALVFYFRKKLSDKFILLCVWSLFALFAITLSQRPYPHYLIQVVAPATFLLSMFFTNKNFEQSLTVMPLTVIFFVPFVYKFWFYPVSSYYLNFMNFATQKVDREVYFRTFSGTTNRNYQIANFLASSSRPEDKVFMWDPDSPTVYALSRKLPPIKYSVPYHVYDYSDKATVVGELSKNPPKFIILTSGNPLPEITPLLSAKYIPIQQIDGAAIYSRINLVQAK